MDITEIRQNIATNISAMRNSSGMTQAQFAEKLNYTDKAISKWERGESVPDIAVLWQIADMFDVTVDWLISNHESSEPTPDAEAVRAGFIVLSVGDGDLHIAQIRADLVGYHIGQGVVVGVEIF